MALNKGLEATSIRLMGEGGHQAETHNKPQLKYFLRKLTLTFEVP